MSTSDADKPPICAPPPAPVADEPSDLLEAEVIEPVVVESSGRLRPGLLLHSTFLGIAVVVVIASMVLQVRNGDQVVLPLVDTALPGTCTFRKLTGTPCPGCGLTRAFISMGHGQFLEAWQYNPAGFFFFVVVAFQIPYRIFQISRIRRGLSEHRFVRFDNWILVALVIVLIAQWMYRVFFGTS